MGINPKTDPKVQLSSFLELGKQLINSVLESITPSEEELIKAHQEEVAEMIAGFFERQLGGDSFDASKIALPLTKALLYREPLQDEQLKPWLEAMQESVQRVTISYQHLGVNRYQATALISYVDESERGEKQLKGTRLRQTFEDTDLPQELRTLAQNAAHESAEVSFTLYGATQGSEVSHG